MDSFNGLNLPSLALHAASRSPMPSDCSVRCSEPQENQRIIPLSPARCFLDVILSVENDF